MAEFAFDAEALSEEEKHKLGEALGPVAEADAPLLFEIVVTDEAQIEQLNAQFRGVDAVTDVLSFPSTEGIFGRKIIAKQHPDCFDGQAVFLGSIVVCEKRAREQAEEYGHSYEREFFYLTVHGVLHCLGYDHMTEEDKRVMRAKEEEVMFRMNLNVT